MNFIYKKFLLLVIGLPISALSIAQVGIGTSVPEGILDLRNSVSAGFVFPKASLSASNVELPVTNPNGPSLVIGTTIFNTNTTSTGSDDVSPGIYAWNGSKWIPQYLREDSAIILQTPLDLRVETGDTSGDTASSDWIDVPGLGNGSTFTPKYTGMYRIKSNFNFGAGKIDATLFLGNVSMSTQEGYFRFWLHHSATTPDPTNPLDPDIFLIYTHAYSLHNKSISGGTYYEQFRHDSSLVIYRQLTAGQVYNFRLEVDLFVSGDFEDDGDGASSDGRAHVGIGVPCTVEFTYLEE